MIYVVKAAKIGLEMIAACADEKLAKREALKMLEQGYSVIIIPTLLIEE